MNWSEFCNITINFILDFIFAGEPLGGNLDPVLKGSFPSQGTDYSVLFKLSRHITIKPEMTLLDIGCAKGRVINWWLKNGFENKIIGIEANTELASKTAYRFNKYANIEIIAGDVFKQFPENIDLIYLYNPFEPYLIDDFKDLIIEKCPKSVQVFYYNCPEISIFIEDNRFQVKIINVNNKLFGIKNDHLAYITRV